MYEYRQKWANGRARAHRQPFVTSVTSRHPPRRAAPRAVSCRRRDKLSADDRDWPLSIWIIYYQAATTEHLSCQRFYTPTKYKLTTPFTIVSHVGLFFQRNHLGYNNFVAFQSRTKTVLCQNVLQPQSNRFICRNWQTVCNDAELQNMALCMHERGTGKQIDLN